MKKDFIEQFKIVLPMMKKWFWQFARTVCLAGLLMPLSSLVVTATAAEVFSLDFTKSQQRDPVQWLEAQGFKLLADSGKIQYQFASKGLVLNVPKKLLAFISKDINQPFNAAKIQIDWGVDKYPVGANWEKAIYREALVVIIFFGTEKLSSGSFFYPNSPQFLAFFLGETETAGKIYIADLYTEGGRYYCQPCKNPIGKPVSTQLDIKALFQQAFKQQNVPPVTQIAIGVDTRNTEGKAQAFLSAIRIFDQ